MPAVPDPDADRGVVREWIVSRRPPKDPVDPREPLGRHWEEERARRRGGRRGDVAHEGSGTVRALTIFLAGAECPFRCVFCDLWKRTLDGPTPRGAIPAQIRRVLAEEAPPPSAALKLYNASNFFDPRAVPPEDDREILSLLAPFRRITVECHPRLVGARCLDFARGLPGRLEVAMGLETVHPEAFPRLNKGMAPDDFVRAAGTLREAGIGVRAFVLVGAPFVPPEETVEWSVRSARWALERGAQRVSLIPTRGGNGAMEALAERGAFHPPDLSDLEAALAGALEAASELGHGIVEADVWDAEAFGSCPACLDARIRRLARMNRRGVPEPRSPCRICGAGSQGATTDRASTERAGTEGPGTRGASAEGGGRRASGDAASASRG